jgi:hypothetical protein
VQRPEGNATAPAPFGGGAPQRLTSPLCSARRGRKPGTWTRIDRDYETLRIGMHTLFHDLGIATAVTAAA